MRSLHRQSAILVLLLSAALAACTQDYGDFMVVDTTAASSSTAGAGASSSTTATGGASGSGTGASTGSGATGGSGAAGGTGGTGGMECGPCSIAHGKPACSDGGCAVASCDPGYEDCNAMAGDGCETPTGTDVANCGACGRICSPTGTSATICAASLCASTCDLGRANCTKPATGPDDGCELDVTANNANCGGCGNDCSSQGYGTGFVCQSLGCRCTSSVECRFTGGGTVTCDATSGLCACDGTSCRPGEACVKTIAAQTCSCNGASACAAGTTCCKTPAGCKNLTTDAANCGACGHACAPGLSCTGGVCG